MSTDKQTPKEVLTPESFLQRVSAAKPGWSQQYGGPAGIATLCSELQEQLISQSEMIAAVRVAALQELLKTHSGTELAAMFGVSKSAISKTNRSNTWDGATW